MRRPDALRLRRGWLPWLLGGVSLALTLTAAWSVHRQAQARDRVRFEHLVQTRVAALMERMSVSTTILQGVAGFFNAVASPVDRDRFQTYIASLEVPKRYPGILGIGYSKVVWPGEEDVLTEEMRYQGEERFRIWSENNAESSATEAPESSDLRTAVVFLEPRTRRNRVAVGYDMASEPSCREAMIRARDTGKPALTGRMVLVQEIDGEKQGGFLLYEPVYRAGRVPSTPEERREALEGFAHIPFRAGDFMRAVFPQEEPRLVALRLFDGHVNGGQHSMRPESLLYSSSPDMPNAPRFHRDLPMVLAGRPWTIQLYSTPEFDASSEHSRAPWILLSGSSVTLALFLATRAQVRARGAAERSAAKLRKNQQRLRSVFESDVMGIFIAGPDGHLVEANNAFLSMIGYTQAELRAGDLNLVDITPAEMRHLDEKALEELKRTGGRMALEKEYIRKDGNRLPVLIRASLVEGSETLLAGFVLDLTQRKQAEDAARRSEDRLRLVTDMIPAFVAYVDRRLRFRFSNRACEDWFEHSEPELYGSPMRELLGEKLFREFLPKIERVLTGEIVQFESQVVLAGKGMREVSISCVPHTGVEGQAEGFVILGTDITEGKKEERRQRFLVNATEALASSLDYAATLDHVVHLAVPELADWCVVDGIEPGGSICRLAAAHPNRAKERMVAQIERLYPSDPEALVGAPRVIRSGQAELVEEVTDEMLKARATDQRHLGLMRGLGIRSFVCAPLISRGRILGAITLVAGDSDRRYGPADLKFLEEVARAVAVAIDNALLHKEAVEERNRLQVTFESIGDAVIVTDSQVRVTFVNPVAEQLTGWSLEEAAGRALNEVFSIADEVTGEVLEDPVARVLRNGTPSPEGDHPVLHTRSGQLIPVDESAAPIRSEEGEITGAILVFRDVSERRRAEAEMLRMNWELAKARDEAVQAFRAKSTFLANMSHELRTPLNAIIGYAEMLQEDAIEQGLEDLGTDLGRIHYAGRHLLSVVSDVLDLAKIEAGKIDLFPEEFEVAEVAEEAVVAIEQTARRGNNQLEMCLGDTGMMFADRTRLRQVLINLLANAAKFTENGTIRLECERREEPDGQDWLEFRIIDTGIGMSPDQLTLLFERFQQIDSSMTRRHGGSGLGLVLSRHFCRMMGGDISVTSKAGAGSTFTVLLPGAMTPVDHLRPALSPAGAKVHHISNRKP